MNKVGKLDVLRIQYHEALKAPLKTAQEIAKFLGDPYSADAASEVVAPSLSRNRS